MSSRRVQPICSEPRQQPISLDARTAALIPVASCWAKGWLGGCVASGCCRSGPSAGGAGFGCFSMHFCVVVTPHSRCEPSPVRGTPAEAGKGGRSSDEPEERNRWTRSGAEGAALPSSPSSARPLRSRGKGEGRWCGGEGSELDLRSRQLRAEQSRAVQSLREQLRAAAEQSRSLLHRHRQREQRSRSGGIRGALRQEGGGGRKPAMAVSSHYFTCTLHPHLLHLHRTPHQPHSPHLQPLRYGASALLWCCRSVDWRGAVRAVVAGGMEAAAAGGVGGGEGAAAVARLVAPRPPRPLPLPPPPPHPPSSAWPLLSAAGALPPLSWSSSSPSPCSPSPPPPLRLHSAPSPAVALPQLSQWSLLAGGYFHTHSSQPPAATPLQPLLPPLLPWPHPHPCTATVAVGPSPPLLAPQQPPADLQLHQLPSRPTVAAPQLHFTPPSARSSLSSACSAPLASCPASLPSACTPLPLQWRGWPFLSSPASAVRSLPSQPSSPSCFSAISSKLHLAGDGREKRGRRGAAPPTRPPSPSSGEEEEEEEDKLSQRPHPPSSASNSHSEPSTPSATPPGSSSSHSSPSSSSSSTVSPRDGEDGCSDRGAAASAGVAGGAIRRYRMSTLRPSLGGGCVAELPYFTARQFVVRACELPRFSPAQLQERVRVCVRVLRDERGQAWFVAKDVCALIGKRVGSVGRAISSLNQRQKARMLIQHTTNAREQQQRESGGVDECGEVDGSGAARRPLVQVMSVLSVDGLRRLLSRSRCDTAKQLLADLLADIDRIPATAPPSQSAEQTVVAAAPSSDEAHQRRRRRSRAGMAADGRRREAREEEDEQQRSVPRRTGTRRTASMGAASSHQQPQHSGVVPAASHPVHSATPHRSAFRMVGSHAHPPLTALRARPPFTVAVSDALLH